VKSLLLDTSIFLWYAVNDPRLSREASHAIASAPTAWVSVVTAWELAVKLGLDKLKLDRPLADLIDLEQDRGGLTPLQLETSDVLAYASLGFPDETRRDPFDRMLVVQAQRRELTLLTSDERLAVYGAFVEVA
jgi:PIN domain nuclease of toxin-antitoxin system